MMAKPRSSPALINNTGKLVLGFGEFFTGGHPVKVEQALLDEFLSAGLDAK